MSTKPITSIEAIDPEATYAAFYIENLRTGAANQLAVVTGTGAIHMLTNSQQDPRKDPSRLFFILLVGKGQS
jgi:hypothetical protein